MARPGGKGIKAETAYAKQLFLYGNGDGKRIMNATKLAEMSGVHVETVRKWLPDWEREIEERLSGTTKAGLAIRLSERSFEASMQALTCIENEMKKVQFELKKFDEITASLEKICENFSLNTDNGDRALELFQAYLQARGSKADLRRQLLAIHKHHAEHSGVSALREVQTTGAKALETARAKVAVKAETAETVRDVTPAGAAVSLLRGS